MQGLGLSSAKQNYVQETVVVPHSGYFLGDGVNDIVVFSSSEDFFDTSADPFTIRFWVKPENAIKKSTKFCSMGLNADTQFFVWYDATFNRIGIRFLFNGVKSQRTYALHDNSAVTGITDSYTGWCSAQRGNTNPQGWTMITVTGNAGDDAASFKMYWNDQQLTTVTVTSTVPPQSDFPTMSWFIGDGQEYPSANNFNGGIDEFAAYKRVLTSGEVASLYNGGVIIPASTISTSDLFFETSLTSEVDVMAGDKTGNYSWSYVSGTFI